MASYFSKSDSYWIQKFVCSDELTAEELIQNIEPAMMLPMLIQRML